MNEDILKLRFWMHQSTGARAEQQDRIAIIPDVVNGEIEAQERGIMMLLCDGMGGLERGSEFSSVGIQKMTEAFYEIKGDEDMAEVLIRCFGHAQTAAVELQEQGTHGGSTLLAAYLRDGMCMTLSCGDSLAVLVRDGGLIRLNREQNLGRILNEQGALDIIDWEDALSSNQRNALISYLGYDKSKYSFDIEAHPFQLLQGDCLALMSDGVSDVLEDSEIQEILCNTTGDPAEKIMEEVGIRQKENQDNYSIVVAKIEMENH